jgi:hypothetical protein
MNTRVGYVTSLFAAALLSGAGSTSRDASLSQLHTARVGAPARLCYAMETC